MRTSITFTMTLSLWCWLLLLCACAKAARTSRNRMYSTKDPTKESLLFTEKGLTKDSYKCRRFDKMKNSFSADGDVTILVARGHKMTVKQCRDYCLMAHPSRYCVVANVHSSGACYLAGYKLHQVTQSTHFRRLCGKGRLCFSQLTGWESRYHTGIILLPEVALHSEVRMADHCRQECEKMADCVGFDVRSPLDYCPYVQFRPSNSTEFVMHRRHC